MEQNTKKSLKGLDVKTFFSKDNLPLLSLIFLALFTLIVVIVSCVALHINVVVACVMAVLEAGLAACLNRIPLWIHGLVFIAQIVCGIIASQVVFMVLMAFIYVFAIVFLFIWANK